MRKVIRIATRGKLKLSAKERFLTSYLQAKVQMIKALIPIGERAVSEQLEEEVDQLAG